MLSRFVSGASTANAALSAKDHETKIEFALVCNVLGKRAGQASEPVKILHILPSTTDYTSKVEDIEIKQIVL
jgi:hypothetical protein